MFIDILSSSQISQLRGSVVNNVEIYSSGSSSPEFDMNVMLNSMIEVSDIEPLLVVSERVTKDDAENAATIYEYLGKLTSTQAADSRLWVTLSHGVFWSYCQKRWKIKGDESSFNTIDARWFEQGGARRGLSRNAISRLWWGAHFTVAPWERDESLKIFRKSDRYWLTKILFSQQQFIVDLFERQFGSSLKLRTVYLAALGNHLPAFAPEGQKLVVSNADNLSKEVAKRILQLLKTRHLEALDAKEILEITAVVVEQVAKEQISYA